jgi:hypothetical protein
VCVSLYLPQAVNRYEKKLQMHMLIIHTLTVVTTCCAVYVHADEHKWDAVTGLYWCTQLATVLQQQLRHCALSATAMVIAVAVQ